MRQGCVLSPRPFCSVLQWAMQDWRAWAEGNGWGIDFHDGYPPLLDLRFADDILIFSDSAEGRIIAGCFDYNIGYDRFETKCFENSHVDNRGTATRPHHDASWTRHCCKGRLWNT